LLPAPLRAVLAAALFLAFDVFFFESFFCNLGLLALARLLLRL
jgi:hypothetical protein